VTYLRFSKVGVCFELEVTKLFLMAQKHQVALLLKVLQLISQCIHLHAELVLFRI
jgi:hypothetical protein